TRGRDSAHIDRCARLVLGALPGGIHLVVLAGLESTLTCQVRIPLADEVERTCKENRGEAAEHHRRQHLGKHVAVGLAEDFRITDGERDPALANTAAQDWNYHKK